MRTLYRMARARQQADWYKLAVMTANIVQPHTKERVSILGLIPPAYRPRVRQQTVPDAEQKEITRRVLDGLEKRTKGHR